MNLLVTAGNTWTPIDQVRGITNVFTGKTGTAIARCAQRRGHQVVLLTSHPELAAEFSSAEPALRVRPYRTFDDLEKALAEEVHGAGLEVIIHTAAVSDYRAAGVYAPAGSTHFRPEALCWESVAGQAPALLDMAASKIKSTAPELWLRLVRTPKLVDRIRCDWGFAGILVKFKLEVGLDDEHLLALAEASRQQSHADLMVANTLEGAASWAYLGPHAGRYERIPRAVLPEILLQTVERLYQERTA